MIGKVRFHQDTKLTSKASDHRNLVVKVSDRSWHVISSSLVTLKTRRVGARYPLNLSRAQTSSRWCGVVVMRGGASSDSDEDISLNESGCEEFEEGANVIDNIPVNSDVYVSRDGTYWTLYWTLQASRNMSTPVF
ncbi:hypothetical protein TNCV_2751641 [Trichonephila clavipes]|nr:hypothetical protein TNCV_2751641 [Trichonephila clavipes]